MTFWGGLREAAHPQGRGMGHPPRDPPPLIPQPGQSMGALGPLGGIWSGPGKDKAPPTAPPEEFELCREQRSLQSGAV